MFHKQNIPASAPPKMEPQTTADTTETDTQETENKDTSIMSANENQDTPSSRPNSPFGRPAMPAQSTAYGTAQTRTHTDGRTLTIGQGITLSGEIENCDQLLVEGTVEATLNGAKLLDIAETGVFYGSVDIEEAVIAGRFEGDITVDGRVTIEATGVVIGTMTYRELTVEAGATIEGKISSFATAGKKTDGTTATDFSKLKEASKTTNNKKASAA